VKLSFLPADLHLGTEPNGRFVVTLQGKEVFTSSSRSKAIKKFNEVKKELEVRFPIHDLSDEEKKELLRRSIVDSLVPHNSVRPKKKSTAKSTRTFG
jgi:hypothetical protein